MVPASSPARHESLIAQKRKQLFQRKIHKCSPVVATPAGEGSVPAFTPYIHGFVVPRTGAASPASTTQSSRQDFTAPDQKLLSAFTDPLATPGQGKAMSSSAGSATAPGHSCHGDSEWQPQSFAHLGLVPCPHTQLAKTLGSASATPAPVLHGQENLGQTKPTQGLTREMNLGNKAKKRDLGKTQSLLSPSETSRQPLPNGGS